jgi:preprotein translocase subunit SecD
VLNKNSIWKVLSALFVVAMCALYALPNLYGEDHAVQISAGRDAVVTQSMVEQVESALAEKSITPKRIEFENEQILVRVSDSDTQLVARETLEKLLGDDYFVAVSTSLWKLICLR